MALIDVPRGKYSTQCQYRFDLFHLYLTTTYQQNILQIERCMSKTYFEIKTCITQARITFDLEHNVV